MRHLVGLILVLPLIAAGPPTRPLDLRNDRVTVRVDPATGAFDAQWPSARASVSDVRLSVDGLTLPAPTVTSNRPTGHTAEVTLQWPGDLQFDRTLRIADSGAITIATTVTNTTGRELPLPTIHALDARGGWKVGEPDRAPASVYLSNAADLACDPPAASDKNFTSSAFLCLADTRSPGGGLVAGYLTSTPARPEITAAFQLNHGGRSLATQSRFPNRRLGPGETLHLDTTYLNADPDPYAALEHYADTVAAASPRPVRKGPTSLWCSWYAHRMSMTEDLVLANAAVAAKYFKPLGMEIIQLDHGWEKGDVTGDWVPNDRFPHGLKWLSDQLRDRYGFRLGLWIAPTDVAETTDTFKAHPDWMLKGPDGKPAVNWRWYWKPNPNCYLLDATQPAVYQHIRDTFARLSAEGASYFKIDFIAASAREDFVPADPHATQGWSPLVRAMQALREGAGDAAWIRYTQTPPVLSAGLADGCIAGDDTFDAGAPDSLRSLRDNARHLAAGYFLNDRLFHREVCDMSVRMQADVEEARLRLAIMSLAGCSVSYSDELQHLPPSRLRMMQQCLPPAGPPMRPLDLFDRAIPSLWHIPCKTDSDQWDVVGLFNWEDTPQTRTLDFHSLGLPDDADVAVTEFWESRFLGLHRKSFGLILPPHTSRILSLRRLTGTPQIIGTDLHVLQGYHDLAGVRWDPAARVLSGTARRLPSFTGRLLVYVPPAYQPHFDFPLRDSSAHLTHLDGPIWCHELQFKGSDLKFQIPFDPAHQ